MPKKAKELTALEVQRLATPGLHFVGGVAGLGLQVLPSGGRSWVLRMTMGTRRRDMGLGGYPDVTLSDARTAAREARAKVREGVDPIEEARAALSALKATQLAALTFVQASEKYLAAKSSEWSNSKHRAQWESTLKTYAYPKLGSLLVKDIELAQVLSVLEPIWTTKTETASRVRGRIESVLDWATVHGYRQGMNPARWKGHLDAVLAAPGKVARVEHHRALAASEMGEFMSRLRSQNGMGAKALEFAILTAARSGEVRGATWAEIDLQAQEWVVPAERMKAKRAHRVPLSPQAVSLLQALPRIESDEDHIVFFSSKGGALSDMTLTKVLRSMEVDATVHGFRSTFRDWISERTSYPGDMAEMALAHTIGSKVEAAYRRGDMLAKRRQMMSDWARFCDYTESKSGDVLPLLRTASA